MAGGFSQLLRNQDVAACAKLDVVYLSLMWVWLTQWIIRQFPGFTFYTDLSQIRRENVPV